MLVKLDNAISTPFAITQPNDSPADILENLAKIHGIETRRLYTKKGTPMTRYIYLNEILNYVLASRNSVQYHPATNRRFFCFTISQKAIAIVQRVTLLTIGDTRTDAYISEKEVIAKFDGKSHQFYIPDVTTEHKRRPRNLPTVLDYASSFNNWELQIKKPA